MAKEPSARRYAEAIFQIVKADNNQDDWNEKLQSLIEMAVNEDVSSLLNGPHVPLEIKKDGIRKLCSGFSKKQTDFVYLLVERGQFDLVIEINDRLLEMADSEKNIKRAKIISTITLKKDYISKIEARLGELTGKKVIGVNEIDKSIIGGIVIKFPDQVLDMSVKGELFNMRESFSKSNN